MSVRIGKPLQKTQPLIGPHVWKDAPYVLRARNALRISTCQRYGTSASPSDPFALQGHICAWAHPHRRVAMLQQLRHRLPARFKSGGLHDERQGTPPLEKSTRRNWARRRRNSSTALFRLARSCASAGMRCATGLPCRVIAMASPCSTARSSSARRALASVALTSRMFNPNRLF